MLLETITFEMHNFKTGVSEEFLVENTELHFAAIARQRFSRNIRFTQTFDFQFTKEYRAPKFIEFADAVEASLSSDYSGELDEIDEMVGVY
jgi:hypothetical protein